MRTPFVALSTLMMLELLQLAAEAARPSTRRTSVLPTPRRSRACRPARASCRSSAHRWTAEKTRQARRACGRGSLAARASRRRIPRASRTRGTRSTRSSFRSAATASRWPSARASVSLERRAARRSSSCADAPTARRVGGRKPRRPRARRGRPRPSGPRRRRRRAHPHHLAARRRSRRRQRIARWPAPQPPRRSRALPRRALASRPGARPTPVAPLRRRRWMTTRCSSTGRRQVEPVDRRAVLKAQLRIPDPPPRQRFELRDPFAEVTYRSIVRRHGPEGQPPRRHPLHRDRPGRKADDGDEAGRVCGRDRADPDPATSARSAGSRRADAPPPSRPRRRPAKPAAQFKAERSAPAGPALEAALNERYVIRHAPLRIGDVTIGQTEYRHRGDTRGSRSPSRRSG